MQDINQAEKAQFLADYNELKAGKRPLSYSGCSDLLKGGWRLFLQKRYFTPQKKDTIGTALGKQFEAMLLCKDPNERFRVISDELSLITKEGRTETETALQTGKMLIRQAQFDSLFSLREHIYRNGREYIQVDNEYHFKPIDNPVLEAFFDPNAKHNEKFGFDQSPVYYELNGQKIPFRGEADIFSADTNMIVDLKISTDDRRAFEQVAGEYNYDLQAAVYSYFLGCDACGLLVYHEPTHELKTYKFATLESGREKLKKAIGLYLQMLEYLQKEHAEAELIGEEISPTKILFRTMLKQNDFKLHIL
jgi:hypothetical protein